MDLYLVLKTLCRSIRFNNIILDRVFYSGGKHLQFKPASVIASARRAGTTATLDQLTKYLTISNMRL